MNKIIIIGAGECGVTAAFSLRDLGYTGQITLISAEAELPYERPPLSKNLCSTSVSLRSRDDYSAADIGLLLNTQVVRLENDNKRIELSSGTVLEYDQLLIATGSQARVISNFKKCKTLRTLSDAAQIHESFNKGARIGIIGAGFIGLELAATARREGAEVTVYEAGTRVLARAVPEIFAQELAERHIREGVVLNTNIDIESADNSTIALRDGTVHKFDMVVAGIGNAPNLDLAKAAGCTIKNGIIVNARFQTSVPDVYAAGDCCNFPWRGKRMRLESINSAQNHGAAAARSMLGSVAEYDEVPWFWSDQYDLNLQVAGIFDADRMVYERPTEGSGRLLLQFDPEGKLNAAARLGIGLSGAKDLRILQKIIQRQTLVSREQILDPSTSLKSIWKGQS